MRYSIAAAALLATSAIAAPAPVPVPGTTATSSFSDDIFDGLDLDGLITDTAAGVNNEVASLLALIFPGIDFSGDFNFGTSGSDDSGSSSSKSKRGESFTGDVFAGLNLDDLITDATAGVNNEVASLLALLFPDIDFSGDFNFGTSGSDDSSSSSSSKNRRGESFTGDVFAGLDLDGLITDTAAGVNNEIASLLALLFPGIDFSGDFNFGTSGSDESSSSSSSSSKSKRGATSFISGLTATVKDGAGFLKKGIEGVGKEVSSAIALRDAQARRRSLNNLGAVLKARRAAVERRQAFSSIRTAAINALLRSKQ